MTKNEAANSNSKVNVLSQEELDRRMAAVQAAVKSLTWQNLEAKGKFTKNDKLSFISDDMPCGKRELRDALSFRRFVCQSTAVVDVAGSADGTPSGCTGR